MFSPGQIIHYRDMCNEEQTSLQRGMNYCPTGPYRIILMSLRPNAPYADKVEKGGEILIYEGHNKKRNECEIPEKEDQPLCSPRGKLTDNGKFYNAAMRHKECGKPPELVRVYEKLRDGIWVYNGLFELLDAWMEESDGRMVFKFRLELTEQEIESGQKKDLPKDLPHTRMIPSHVKLEVWKRDGGKCTKCSSSDNLHFDHVLPFSKGGTSLKAENIQLLCARHNLEKRDRIE